MMHIHMMCLFMGILFFILTPGVLLSLPPGGSLMTKAAVHAIVFAIIYHITHRMAERNFYRGY
jgi:hypothetical protein